MSAQEESPAQEPKELDDTNPDQVIQNFIERYITDIEGMKTEKQNYLTTKCTGKPRDFSIDVTMERVVYADPWDVRSSGPKHYDGAQDYHARLYRLSFKWGETDIRLAGQNLPDLLYRLGKMLVAEYAPQPQGGGE